MIRTSGRLRRCVSLAPLARRFRDGRVDEAVLDANRAGAAEVRPGRQPAPRPGQHVTGETPAGAAPDANGRVLIADAVATTGAGADQLTGRPVCGHRLGQSVRR